MFGWFRQFHSFLQEIWLWCFPPLSPEDRLCRLMLKLDDPDHPEVEAFIEEEVRRNPGFREKVPSVRYVYTYRLRNPRV